MDGIFYRTRVIPGIRLCAAANPVGSRISMSEKTPSIKHDQIACLAGAHGLDGKAALIADRGIMPELRLIWPHAYAETVTTLKAVLTSYSHDCQRGAPPLT